MDASDIPDADDLTIGVSPDGKWLAFDFKVGEKRAVITMHSRLMPRISEALMAVLRDDTLAKLPTEELPHGWHSGHAVEAKEFGTSILPFGEAVVLELGLPANAKMRFSLIPQDAAKLQLALGEGVRLCQERQTATKQ